MGVGNHFLGKKKKRIADVMAYIDDTYRPASAAYQSVVNLLDKKASMDEIEALWLMVSTSADRRRSV